MITDYQTSPLMKFTGEVYFESSSKSCEFPFTWPDTSVTSEKFEGICQNVFPEDTQYAIHATYDDALRVKRRYFEREVLEWQGVV